MPDQKKSSAAVEVPPLGRRKTPMWKSAEFVLVLAAWLATTWVRADEPVDARRPTVLEEKSMSYAKLYHVPGTSCVDHLVTPPIIQRRLLSAPDEPESVPYLSSVKWLCREKLT
jgi:hypothetical protein